MNEKKYGIMYAPISGRIVIGQLDSKGKKFKGVMTDASLEATAAVLQMIKDKYNSDLSFTTTDNQEYRITVSAVLK